MRIVHPSLLLAGVATVHWSEGWFVVGGGRNGREFRFLLIVCLLAITLAASAQKPASAASRPVAAHE